MITYIVYSKRTNGLGNAVKQLETKDKSEAQQRKTEIDRLPELCAWIEEVQS